MLNWLCHSQIAMAKCSIWSCVDTRWCSSTCRIFSQTSLKSTVWWQSYLPSFPISMATKVSWSPTNGFLAVGICKIQSVSVSSINCVRFERCLQSCNSRDSYCHGTCYSAIHRLLHAKCHHVWRRSCGKFVKHNKILYFMLLLCPWWLSSLLAYPAPVVFMLQLPFECYLAGSWSLEPECWAMFFLELEAEL